MATTKQVNLNQGKIVRWGILAFLLFILFVMLTNTTFITIDPGHKGVLFKRFAGGLKVEKIYNQGFHVVAPWNKMFVYDVRTQEHFEGMEVLSKNGLNIKIDLTIRFQPEAQKIGYLHDEIGVDYLSRIIQPEIRSATREVIGKYLPEELYSSKREAIQDEIYTRTAASIAEKHIYLDAVLIRSVILPQSLQAAIERKLKEEQTMLEYDYKLQKELKEKERMIIEANAKSESNLILNASLTEKILRDKGIEATLELAKSPNSKVVIVGSGDDGLPLILGN